MIRLSQESLSKANLNNLIRLACFLKINIEKLKNFSSDGEKKHFLIRKIQRWEKTYEQQRFERL